MSNDVILHFSNSSNQSDQSSKIAKLEARLVGKASSAVTSQLQVQAQMNSLSAPAKFECSSDGLFYSLAGSDDSDDDDNGGAYLIQANTQKRQKVGEECSANSSEHVDDGNISGSEQQAAADARHKTIEPLDNKLGGDVYKRKQSHGQEVHVLLIRSELCNPKPSPLSYVKDEHICGRLLGPKFEKKDGRFVHCWCIFWNNEGWP